MKSVLKLFAKRASPSLYRTAQTWNEVRRLRGWTAADERRRKFYCDFIRPGDLVFDVGANLGNRSKVFLQLGAWVVAFEPQSSCAEILRRGLPVGTRFRVVQTALGEQPGSAELRVGAANVLATMSESWIDATTKSGRFSVESWQRVESVDVTTLDRAILEFGRPRFIKVDVEGFERQVFAGLSQSLESGSFEFAGEFLSAGLWCLQKLSGMGDYRFQFSASETMTFDWPDWQPHSQARDALAAITSSNIHAWGDVYFRLNQ